MHLFAKHVQIRNQQGYEVFSAAVSWLPGQHRPGNKARTIDRSAVGLQCALWVNFLSRCRSMDYSLRRSKRVMALISRVLLQ